MPRVSISKEAAPTKVVTTASRLGHNIRTARKRRRLRQMDLATRAGIEVQTLRRVENGSLGTGIGAYIAALWALGLERDVAQVAAPETDLEGKTLEAATRGQRVRPSDTLPSDF